MSSPKRTKRVESCRLAAFGYGRHIEGALYLAVSHHSHLEKSNLEKHTMAVSCDDQPNHLMTDLLFPPGIPGPHPCHVPTISSVCQHPQHGDFTVCDGCHSHTKQMLLLTASLGNPPPPNLLRLSQGPPPAAGGTRLQPGVTPPELPAGVPVVPPFVADWRTGDEAATGRLDSTRGDPPFEGFLTRCCKLCERLIQSKINHLSTVMIPAPVPLWEQYPVVSCECKRTLALFAPPRNRLCKPHREEEWNNLVHRKDNNDRWLRNIEWDAKAQRLAPASTRTLRKRVRNCYYRACRVSISPR